MVRPADKLQLKAATILPLVGLARSKLDPSKHGHRAQHYTAPGGPEPKGHLYHEHYRERLCLPVLWLAYPSQPAQAPIPAI